MPMDKEDEVLAAMAQEVVSINTSLGNQSLTATVPVFNWSSISIAVLSVIFVLAIASNIFALVVMGRREKLSRMHWFIVHLCIADILVAIFNVLPEILRTVIFPFRGGVFLCKTVAFMQLFVLYLSAYILVMTAIDRYIAICHPIMNQSCSKRRVKVMIAVAWCLATLMSIPQLFVWKWYDVTTRERYDRCWAEFHPKRMWLAYIIYFLGVVYVVPFILLAYCYGRISYAVCTNMRRRESCRVSKVDRNANDSSNGVLKQRHQHAHANTIRGKESLLRVHSTGNFSKTKLKTAKLSAVVMVTYILCWLPFFVTHMWAIGDTTPPMEAIHPLQVIANLLASLNSCCNPWIYFAFTGTAMACSRKRQRHMSMETKTSAISYRRTTTHGEEVSSEVTGFPTRSLSLSKSSSCNEECSQNTPPITNR